MANQVPFSPADPAGSRRAGLRRASARSTAAAVCGALAVLTAALLPAGAEAAVVTRPVGSSQFTLLAAPGEVNRVRVSDDGPGFVRIRAISGANPRDQPERPDGRSRARIVVPAAARRAGTVR